MAANEYYNNSYSQKPHPALPHDNDTHGDSWGHQQPSSPTLVAGGYSHNYDNGGRYGHYHSNSDNDLGESRMGHNNDYYSEDIPLKSNAANNKPEWADDTRYHPSPHDLPTEPLNLSDPVRRPSRRRKHGYFAKKIPWVTHITSLVQIIIFIVEIVKNGMSHFIYIPSSGFCQTDSANAAFSPVNRISHHDKTLLQSHDRPIALCPDKPRS